MRTPTDHEILTDIDLVLTDPFAFVWAATPTFMREASDYSTAHYFWLRGQQDAENAVLAREVDTLSKHLARDVDEMGRIIAARRQA